MSTKRTPERIKRSDTTELRPLARLLAEQLPASIVERIATANFDMTGKIAARRRNPQPRRHEKGEA